jgi:hypothetical protein
MGWLLLRLALAVGAVACGRLEFSSDPRPDSRTPDDSPVVDAGVCAEVPCRLVEEQCGCADGKACQRTGATTDERSCIAAGTAAADEACALDAECAAGLACVAVLGTEGRCQRYCAGDGDCAPGLQCAELVEGVGIGICGSACTLDGGCPVGEACKIELVFDFDSANVVAFPVCVPPAGNAAGNGCSLSTECAAGLICDLTPGTCGAMCRFDGSLPCATGTCTSVEAPILLGGLEHGVCR